MCLLKLESYVTPVHLDRTYLSEKGMILKIFILVKRIVSQKEANEFIYRIYSFI